MPASASASQRLQARNALAARQPVVALLWAASLQAAYAYRPASLDAAASRDPTTAPPTLSTRHGAEDCRYDRIEDALAVAGLMASLSERERAIPAMRFAECLSQTQIAARLGISHVHVSRLLGIALERLRRRLAEESCGAPSWPAPANGRSVSQAPIVLARLAASRCASPPPRGLPSSKR
ncbi:MAG: hypothetical protein JO299_05175 [Gammaproteobacteria bacterium]|nr:hypothetical protein [Gammaproteobacteria bacterium]